MTTVQDRAEEGRTESEQTEGAGTRLTQDVPKPFTEARPDDDLVSRLRNGVERDGETETDDGVIELFDIEGANDLMDEAADAILAMHPMRIEIITNAICQSRKFESGQGTCAVMCMDQLGDVRSKGCAHHQRIHADLAERIRVALAKAGAA